MIEQSDKEQIAALFGPDPLEAFYQGMSGHLVGHRNRQLGSLLISERNVFYIQILYRMLLFKREHELEPLYEDIYQSVRLAQESVDSGEYTSNRFRMDMAQLSDWNLVSFRIEKERLRGYRDNRKRKFRYALTEECGRFVQWLEFRLLDDLEDQGHDTRDLLQDVCGTLNELLRLLHHLKKDDEDQSEAARRIIFQLAKADDLTRSITVSLIEFNGRLLQFILKQYDVAEIKQIIAELDSYVNAFLNRVYALRKEILPSLERLQQKKNQEKIDLCFRIMEQERLQAPHLMQGAVGMTRVGIADRLYRFYVENGKLDLLHQRIGASVIKVWQKLRSHLRELERKNNRLQDLKKRISEIARLPEEKNPDLFLNDLLSPAQLTGDMHFWDAFQKAEPPEPRKRLSQKEGVGKNYLRKKQPTGKPVQTMDEARLSALSQWLSERVMQSETSRISGLTVQEQEDFHKTMELAQAGYLDAGKRLGRIGYRLFDTNDPTTLSLENRRLGLRDITVKQKDGEG